MPKVIILDAGGILDPGNESSLLYKPELAEMLRHLIASDFKIIALSTDSDAETRRTKGLLTKAGFPMITVHRRSESESTKPKAEAFLELCKSEGVEVKECLHIDDREFNCEVAAKLGMRAIGFKHSDASASLAHSVHECMRHLVELGLVKAKLFNFDQLPLRFNRGLYPSLSGRRGSEIVYAKIFSGAGRKVIITDTPNEDGNLRKRCLYESRLAKLICEDGKPYWRPAYQKINQIFLADFDLKSKNVLGYTAYFSKIESSLKKINLLDHARKYEVAELRAKLNELFSGDFNLANVSQFYYDVWLDIYGSEALEAFVFLVNELRKSTASADYSPHTFLILVLCSNLSQDVNMRKLAYCMAQPYVSCGPPQLRGRAARGAASNTSTTIGILRDDDPEAKALTTASHFAAKVAFRPAREHPIAAELEECGAAIIGGPSGTLGRNVLMLAPLIESGLLTQEELLQYILGFWADLVYRGHHSFEEIALMASQLLIPFKSWLDPIRNPLAFYEQLLTPEFLDSEIYRKFSDEHKDFFGAEFRAPKP